MNKLFSKIAALSVGLAMAVGVGVALGHQSVKEARADSQIMLFDFEDNTAHRTSGSNSYSGENKYSENGSDITLMYADSVTTGSPLSGSANVLGRVAKNQTEKLPFAMIGPIDLSSYNVSSISYKIKSVNSLTITASYSLDGTNWVSAPSYTGSSTTSTKSVEGLSINEESSVYFRIAVSISNGQSTTSNRDTQIDDFAIFGTSTSTKELESISCPDQSVTVGEMIDVASQITYTPNDAANKNVNYSVKSGGECIDLETDGKITGKKSGTAVITITPEDTHANPIDVNVEVQPIPAPALTVGSQYVIHAEDSKNSAKGELTGVVSNLGTVESYETIPACSYVLDTFDGYFENSVAFKNGTKYLSLNSASNNLHTSDVISKNSSWFVTSSDDVISIVNAAFPARSLQYNYNSGNPRFACYTNGGQIAPLLYEYTEKPLTDFSISSELTVYKTGTGTISVTYTPADAADKTLTWASDNEAVATVDENGVVTGVTVGECNVTATKNIGGTDVVRTCVVSVLNNASAHRGTAADPFDVNDAVNVAKGIFTEDLDGTAINLENEYYVVGKITHTVNRTTSTLTFWIGDNETEVSADTGAFEVFKAGKVYGEALGTYYTDKEDKDVAEDFGVGYKVLVKSTLTEYKGTPETSSGQADIVFNNYIEARHYAEGFNSAFEAENVCDADGNSNIETLSNVWGEQSSAFTSLDESARELLTNAEANSKASATAVEKCAAKYDYIGGKYGTQLSAEFDFMGRNPAPITDGNYFSAVNNSSNSYIIIIVISSVSVLSFGLALFLRKKRSK